MLLITFMCTFTALFSLLLIWCIRCCVHLKHLSFTVQTIPRSSLSLVKSCDLLRYITPCVLISNYQQLQETRPFNLQGHFYPTSADSRIFVEFIKHIESIRCHDGLHFHSHEILYLLMAPDLAATSGTAYQMLFSHQVIMTRLTF
jgi:hypothetical protein